ncbi:hypothetical protein ON010_g2918 [Phytophthora cinnamomi]|nr:hypothetical protein ON010_g2918 [Phytophthora cinnamomi]
MGGGKRQVCAKVSTPRVLCGVDLNPEERRRMLALRSGGSVTATAPAIMTTKHVEVADRHLFFFFAGWHEASPGWSVGTGRLPAETTAGRAARLHDVNAGSSSQARKVPALQAASTAFQAEVFSHAGE